ncbi:MAG: hypothetical protein ABJH05_15420 [Fulvivirga sp.]
MKTTFKSMYVVVMALMLLTSPGFSFDKSEKVISKARAIIEKASPDDWESYAKAAELCVRKNVNLAEAKAWLDTSLKIKNSVLANEVAGDYYILNKLYDKAIDHYVKSMLLVKEKDFYADTSGLQEKIERAKAKR